MCEIPVFYATSEGQTRRIAERLADVLRTLGFHSDAIDLTTAQATHIAWDDVRGAIVGASLHAGHHQRAASEFVRTMRQPLNAVPSAFFSVSLSAASSHPEEVATAERLARAFVVDNGWQPALVTCVAGRLAYTRYGLLKRLMMRSIARKEGASTDMRHDQELTDWGAVERFAADVAQAVRQAAPPQHLAARGDGGIPQGLS